jgi:hypothetical protein
VLSGDTGGSAVGVASVLGRSALGLRSVSRAMLEPLDLISHPSVENDAFGVYLVAEYLAIGRLPMGWGEISDPRSSRQSQFS